MIKINKAKLVGRRETITSKLIGAPQVLHTAINMLDIMRMYGIYAVSLCLESAVNTRTNHATAVR